MTINDGLWRAAAACCMLCLGAPASAQTPADQLLLKDSRPKSIVRAPERDVVLNKLYSENALEIMAKAKGQ